ncbi:MAG TPA: type II secretion system protein [Candidatus Dormibacteraeota bacterium]|nr:type II secretion system protein [Candidatus Dormibacteraeota bacterium]
MNKKQAPQRGFTLIELLMVVLLLSIVVGALFSQIERAQVRYKVEDQKVDLTQQEREFIDQFTRDLHQAGYPSVAVYGGTFGLNSFKIAAGVWSISSTDLRMEGDVDGTGVQSVEYSYFDGTGWSGPGPNPCPCLRRSATAKVDGVAPSLQTAGAAFTQVQNVVPLALQPIFSAYDKNGSPVDISSTITDPTQLAKIKSVQITVTTQGLTRDNDVHNSIQVSMTGMARLVNN